jgi:DNA-binding GntR family transcriptional regulator
MTTSSDSLEKKQLTAADTAYRAIQNAIVTGHFKEGSTLTEQELVEFIGVSRTPIREAINRLASDGFINITSGNKNRKSYVARFSRKELIELSELRAVIEAFAARRAATLITPGKIEELEQIQESIDSAIDANRRDLIQTFATLNERFHSVIWETGSMRAARLLAGTLSAPVQAVRPPESGKIEHLRRASTYHKAIIAALKRGDGEAAALQMAAHIHSIIDRLSED